ncbi:cytosine deaminase protein-like protein [Phyllosticta citriasiana]|uniref:cytosine deaminase protein-like protein n=1 Tax=Phyllosticta citriasiana TaxID=595635 RepID=UPI0030FD4656
MAARLPGRPISDLWDLLISDGRVASIEAHDPRGPRLSHLPGVLDASGCLLAPSLCHAHIHLDKCFLLQDPKFADLEIEQGDFAEALALTQKAKARFEEDDLLRRGRQLIEESIQYGVTAMRAFVEVDADVGFKCLDAGLRLKQEFETRCDVQICVFAQLPLFSGPDAGETIRHLMSEAVVRNGVDVVGSTPYVESKQKSMQRNVEWIASLALEHGKFLDLHMDYHLDRAKEPFVWEALETLKMKRWVEEKGRMITLGHCTRLTHFNDGEWSRLREAIGDLSVSFVGLPTSDLFMMRSDENVRGTLNVPKLIQEHKLQAAISVNNVGNAFTPQGSCDPLAIASLGIGVYQTGTRTGAEILYGCVSNRAKAAIGLAAAGIEVAEGDPADFVLLDSAGPEWRCRKRLAEVVYDPPAVRKTVKGGHITTS